VRGARLLALSAIVAVGIGLAVEARSRVSSDAADDAPSDAGHDVRDSTVDAGPAAAVRMVDRLQLFRTGNAGSRLELDAPQLTALLRHAVPGLIPQGVRDPSVSIVDEEIRVRARVEPGALSGGEVLSDVLGALPERVDVELRGTLHRVAPSAVEYRIERATVGAVPLPNAVVAALVRRWPGGRVAPVEGEGLPPALRAPWSSSDGHVRVSGGRVVIERPEPMLVQSVDGSGGA
jgi:hypothetical protein